MSENKVDSGNVENKAKDEPSVAKPSKVKKAKKTDSNQSRSGWSILGIVIGLVAIVVAVYDYWLLQPQLVTSAELKANQESIQAEIVALVSSVGSLNGTLAEEKKFREQAAIEHDALKASMQTMSAMLGRTSEAWRLAEIEYLLTIANHRLYLAQDLKTAIAIFTTADERIKALGDPGLLPIRKAISDELSALSSIKEPDIEGVALRLGSLASAVENLPLIDKERIATAIQQNEVAQSLSWKDIPSAVWEDIKSMVQVRRHEQPVEPLLPPAESWFLYQNLRLKLEQARLSALRRDTAIFKQYVADSDAWIKMFFDQEAGEVASASALLDSLKVIELKPAYPDVSNSLRILRTYLHEQRFSVKKASQQATEQENKGSAP